MVDPFTGDFNYNIPLLDVEGYPINIAYHGGVGMEQEASWVGLGWNINPGAVNRQMRGLPDDFDGDTVEKELYIKPDTTIRIGLGGGMEWAGLGDPYVDISADMGGYLTLNNYRGVSVDFTSSGGINLHAGPVSAGFNLGASMGSQSGASIDYGASLGFGSPRNASSDISGSLNANIGGNYNPRNGMRNAWNFSASGSFGKNHTRTAPSSTGVSVQIGGFNQYSPVVTNRSYMNSYSGQLKIGMAVYSVFVNGKGSASFMKTVFDTAGHRRGYGYLHLHDADSASLLDFNREKDGNWNPTMHLLPQTHLAYDVYDVSGQGTGGSFRPFRNDIGSVFDPVTGGDVQEKDDYSVEAGLPWLFSLGAEIQHTSSISESGPWTQFVRKHEGPQKGYYEDVYFKEAGEITENNNDYLDGVGNTALLKPDDLLNVAVRKSGSDKRVVRGNYIYPISGSGRDADRLLDDRQIQSYTDSNGFAGYPVVHKTAIPRTNGTAGLCRKPSQTTEIVQIQKDGRRYVYGLPVLNNVQREVTFAARRSLIDDSTRKTYQVSYVPGQDDRPGNGNGTDEFYSSMVTPTYVATHLLTAVLSNDYSDVTGNGISDDDLGTYTKFNYSRKSDDYRWRSPAQSRKAQYNPGFFTDSRDDRGTYMAGSREQWMLHSIETKNYVAEFYVSERKDARGVTEAILGNSGSAHYKNTKYQGPTASPTDNRSYKLDSIVLYNKHDRFLHPASAQPLKSVHFTYNYYLCKKTPNSVADSGGKLTLNKIQIRYGTSSINMSAAYTFDYDSAYNYCYNEAHKDRWGNYMRPVGTMNNFEFPFTRQDAASDSFARAWSLSSIGLPSGGVIRVQYEADDYGYVQNRPATRMFMVEGVGNSPDFNTGSQLYFSERQPYLYYYFKRQRNSETPGLSLRQNYLYDTSLMYYNIAVGLAEGKYEPVKGYATILRVDSCPNDADYGYVQMEDRALEGMNGVASPVVYTALNLGRYSLPHIMFPGANPDVSDMDNMVAGLYYSIGEMFNIRKNPLKYYMQQGKAKRADLSRSFIRLIAPGLKKKGGGQRVKSVKFYDSWDKMAGGVEAVYGKEYFYTIDRKDGRGVTSSGVASWEPMTGGDENPGRLPVSYRTTERLVFPPNDPVELYQETPIGESFFPGGVVGYERVTSRSINQDKGRSSQSEDISTFYTAREYPILTDRTAIDDPVWKELNMTDITYTRQAKQGFTVWLNDMHGKPNLTEHWVLKPGNPSAPGEFISSQENRYFSSNGQLSSSVPAFVYNAANGRLGVETRNMGTETDVTVDSRIRNDETKTFNISANLNGFLVFVLPVAIPLGYGFPFTTISNFKMATVTKVTQQYGILEKVITKNQDANTELHNEVFDPLTGNVLVTSVDNEFGDRQYTASFPAYWAYKEMGPAYENMNMEDEFTSDIIIDTFGVYAQRFVNYSSAFSSSYQLPSNMPVGLTAVDEQMKKFKLGDELLIYAGTHPADPPTRVWVMGYTSDLSHCYLVLATREPYKQSGDWLVGHTIASNASSGYKTYKVVRSGARNRLGETIQSFTTTDRSNIFPYLKNDLTGLINFSAQRYNHTLGQVFAANVISDSINPFVTGKVGIYRPQTELLNIKRRDYFQSTSRNKGTFSSASYWRTEQDNFPGYCPDSIVLTDQMLCSNALDSVRVVDATAVDDYWVRYYPNAAAQAMAACNPTELKIYYGTTLVKTAQNVSAPDSFILTAGGSFNNPVPSNVTQLKFVFKQGCCEHVFDTYVDQLASNHYQVMIRRNSVNGLSALSQYAANLYVNTPTQATSANNTPYRVRRKIQLGKVGHYEGSDNENWVKASQVTKYNWFGAEIENKEEGLGYNSAVYGYGQQLPVCVAKNARHGEVLFEGFEDYTLLRPVPNANQSYMPLLFSPFEPFINVVAAVGSLYQKLDLQASTSGNFKVTTEAAHTGNYSIKTTDTAKIPLDGTGAGMSAGYSFGMHDRQKYVASVWVKAAGGQSPAPGQAYGALPRIMSDTSLTTASSQVRIDTFRAKTGPIEGWQQFEVSFEVPPGYTHFVLLLNANYYFDDLRIYPFESNSKGFVYDPVTRKLTATLDENNFATFYEYDAEGNLVRTKRETDQGVLTISETRSTHRKQQ